jgi:hypothetical protein
VSTSSARALIVEKPILSSFAQNGMSPQRITSRRRCRSLASYRTTGSGSVGATFQLAAKFGVGRSGGMPNAILMSLAEERWARPHIS